MVGRELLPEWAWKLISGKTPYLASDENMEIVNDFYSDKWIGVRTRGFVYRIDRKRQQVL